jgi:hypothetical protein
MKPYKTPLSLLAAALSCFLLTQCEDSSESDENELSREANTKAVSENETNSKTSNNDGSDSSSDNTSSADDVTALSTKTYALAVPIKNWTKPAGVGAKIGRYVPTFAMSIQSVAKGASTSFDVLMGTLKDNDQNTCNKTKMLNGVVSQDAAFTIGPDEFEVVIEGPKDSAKATMHGLSITGIFVDNGAKFKNGTLTATMDFRDIYMLFTLVPLANPNPDMICRMAPNMGFQCEPCPTDGLVYCMTIKATNLHAEDLPDLSIQEVTDYAQDCMVSD